MMTRYHVKVSVPKWSIIDTKVQGTKHVNALIQNSALSLLVIFSLLSISELEYSVYPRYFESWKDALSSGCIYIQNYLAEASTTSKIPIMCKRQRQ
eukprot:scaffold12052_cov73-Attheya_sp.AAC.8